MAIIEIPKDQDDITLENIVFNETTASAEVQGNVLAVYDNVKGGYGSYSDANTQTNPIITTIGVWTQLTNDGLGSGTDLVYLPPNVTQLWDTTLNQFDTSQLSLGETATFRSDIVVTPSQNNTVIELELLVNLRDSGGVLVGTENLAFGTEILGRGAGVAYEISEVKTFGVGNQYVIYGEALVRIKTSRPCDVEVKRFFIGVTK
jgi:hypothetical protein